MRYVEPTEENYQAAKSAVRWGLLAALFMVVSFVAQIVWFIFLITNNPKTMAAFIVFGGSYVLALYCKWCSDDVKPEHWK